MPLIEPDQVKTRFPKWQTFLQREENPDDTLSLQIGEAEKELRRYVSIGETLPEELDPVLMALIRKHVFSVLHGDTEFEDGKRPQILRDYDRAVKELERYRSGELLLEDPESTDDLPMIQSKARRFGTWFR